MLRRQILLVASLLLVFASSAAGSVSQRVSSLPPLEQGVLTDINALRQQHGLSQLHLSASLSAAARQHSVEMATRGYFSHSSANGSPFNRRIARYYPLSGP